MHQKFLIYKKWEEMGIVSSHDPRLAEFLSFFMKHPNLDWDAFGKLLHSKFKDLFDALVPPLLEIDDELISLNIVKRLESKKTKKERALVQSFIANKKLQRVAPALEAIARMNDSVFDRALRKRPNLPPVVAAILLERAQQKGLPAVKPRH